MARIFVAPVSLGLGDLVVSLPAVDAVVFEAAHTGDEAWLVTRAASQALLAERIEGLAGWVDEEVLSIDGKPEIAFINLEDQTDAAMVQRLLDTVPS